MDYNRSQATYIELLGARAYMRAINRLKAENAERQRLDALSSTPPTTQFR